MIKTLKILFAIVILIIGGIFIIIKVISEPLPEGKSGNEADQMALDMMQSLNKDAWKRTETVSWTFKGIHNYQWNIPNHQVIVKWDDYMINLDHSTATGELLEPKNDKNIDELIKNSWDYFNNDSFWLCAPFKAFDNGTERSIVTLEDGRKGLMVAYSSGGSTPGDSYVWILGEDNKPISIKMWVSIIPIGGIEFTWENYTQLKSGAWIAQDHWLYGKINIDLSNIK